MMTETASQRMLRELNEREKQFRTLNPALELKKVKDNAEVYRHDLDRPSSKQVIDPLGKEPYQQAMDIVQKLASPTQSTRRTLPVTTAAPNVPIQGVADLGTMVRKARKSIRMSQGKLASHAGVGRRFVSELERGKPTLEFDKVIACALALGIDLLARNRGA